MHRQSTPPVPDVDRVLANRLLQRLHTHRIVVASGDCIDLKCVSAHLYTLFAHNHRLFEVTKKHHKNIKTYFETFVLPEGICQAGSKNIPDHIPQPLIRRYRADQVEIYHNLAGIFQLIMQRKTLCTSNVDLVGQIEHLIRFKQIQTCLDRIGHDTTTRNGTLNP